MRGQAGSEGTLTSRSPEPIAREESTSWVATSGGGNAEDEGSVQLVDTGTQCACVL